MNTEPSPSYPGESGTMDLPGTAFRDARLFILFLSMVTLIWMLAPLFPKLSKHGDDTSFTVLATLEGHTNGVNSVAFSPDGKYMLSGSWDNTLKLWDFSKRTLIREYIGHTGGVRSVAFSPDGKYAVSGSDDQTLRLWLVSSGKELRKFEGHEAEVLSVAYSPDGSLIASGGNDKTVKLWQSDTGNLLQSLEDHKREVLSVAFSPDGTLLASGAADRKILLWEVASGNLLHTFSGHGDWIRALAFSPDGAYLLSGSDDQTLKLWDVGQKQLIRTLSESDYGITDLAFSPGGHYAISGSFGNLMKLWNIETGETLGEFHGHTDWVYAVAFAPDGTHVLSGSWDTTLKLWETPVSDPAGATASSARLVNISTRAQAMGGSDDIFAAFVIQGSGNKTVMVRGLGVNNTDTLLTLVNMTNPQNHIVLGSSDNWENGNPGLNKIQDLPPNLRPQFATDSGLLVDLSAGVYSVIISSKTDSGQAVAGVDDVGGTGDARLVNISTRAQALSGADAIFAAFIIQGDGTLPVIIRGLGVNGTDTLLKVLNITNPKNHIVLGTNDNWADSPQVNEINELPANLRPQQATDSGLLLHLPAGTYSAIIESRTHSGLAVAGVDALR